MGRKVSLTIELDDLPPDQVATLEMLLQKADFFNLPASLIEQVTPDSFLYVITVTTETQQHTVRANDTSVSESLRPLLDELTNRARSR